VMLQELSIPKTCNVILTALGRDEALAPYMRSI
jgi:hypothetical protein